MALKDIVLFGAGGLGREVLFQINEMNKKNPEFNVLGFVDDSSELQGKYVSGLPVLGDSEWLLNYGSELCVALCFGNASLRKKIYEKIKINENLSFPNILADDLRCSESVEFGIGCIVCFSNVITVDVKIGNFTLINNSCTIGHDAETEDFVTLYPAVNVSGNVKIKTLSEIGVGSQIIQGITVGEDVTVGAGAVVVRDLPPHCTAVGVPAKPIK